MKRLILLLSLLILFFACEENGEDNPTGPIDPVDTTDDGQDNVINWQDTADIWTFVDSLMFYQPTWDELKKFTNNLTYVGDPPFLKRALAKSELIEPVNNDWITPGIIYYDQLYAEFNVNTSSALFTNTAPFINTDGTDPDYPMRGEIFDKKLRSMATILIREKMLEKRTFHINFWPPSVEFPRFSSEAALDDFIDNRVIPEKIEDAKMCEFAKVDYFIPFPLEFELWMKNIGGYEEGGYFDTLTDEDMISKCNEIASRILTNVKANYNGKVCAHSYNNYQFGGSIWDQLDFSGYDQIHFAIFPTYDIETTEAYIDSQYVHNMKVVERSGNIPWMVNELSVQEKLFPSGNLANIEADLYEAVFAKFESLEKPPIGAGITSFGFITEAGKQKVKDYFNSK